MGFVNEVVSDDDIDRYGLPFRKGSGRYWTRDAERDYYLWGGKSGNPALGEQRIGSFYLYIDGQALHVKLKPGHGSIRYSDSPFIIRWDSIISVDPSLRSPSEQDRVISILREALAVYGDDGRENKFAKNRIVISSF